MKLVISYNGGDGYTFSCRIHEPIEFESPEALLVAIDERWKTWKEIREHSPNEYKLLCIADEIPGTNLTCQSFQSPNDGSFEVPSIRPLEQWWEEELGK